MNDEYEVVVRVRAPGLTEAIEQVEGLGSRVIGAREIGRCGRPPVAGPDAREFLRDFLLSEGESRSGDVTHAARVEGIADRTLRRAAQELGVVKRGAGKATKWSLPKPSMNGKVTA
jgi:hypothetical protein